jgi:hypothetical protein
MVSHYEEQRAEGRCGWRGCKEVSGERSYCPAHMAYFSKAASKKWHDNAEKGLCPRCGGARDREGPALRGHGALMCQACLDHSYKLSGRKRG